jgi:hypothetical protein
MGDDINGGKGLKASGYGKKRGGSYWLSDHDFWPYVDRVAKEVCFIVACLHQEKIYAE